MMSTNTLALAGPDGSTSRRAGFTLVELLVVVAIIALLIGILIPALSAARASAIATKSVSNLRQLAHGWHVYADEHDDVMLPGRYANLGGGASNPDNWYPVLNGQKTRPRWIAVLGTYIDYASFDTPDVNNERQDYVGEPFVCPTVPDRLDERNGAYGYNYQFLGNARRTNGSFRNFPVRRARISAFAGTVMAANNMGTAAQFAEGERAAYQNDGTDFNALGNHGWSLDPPRLTPDSDRGTGDPGSPRTAVEGVHTGRAAVVWLDGHTTLSTPGELGYAVDAEGRYLDEPGVDERLPTNKWFSGTLDDKDPPNITGL
ncbi:MAG: type II secretion system protein [Phycisphaerales bacterium]